MEIEEPLLGCAVSFTQSDMHQITKPFLILTDICMRQVHLMFPDVFNSIQDMHTPHAEQDIHAKIKHNTLTSSRAVPKDYCYSANYAVCST